jgi:hypothetical protein
MTVPELLPLLILNSPAVTKLDPVTLPVAVSVPVTFAPVVVATMTLVPLGAKLTFPLAAVIIDIAPVSTMFPVMFKLVAPMLPVNVMLAVPVADPVKVGDDNVLFVKV